jgi:hypothetical protein
LHFADLHLNDIFNLATNNNSPWPHEGQQQQQQIESAIRRKLESSGEIDRIHHRLHANLSECGWRNAIQDAAKEAIRQRKGLQDQLVAELTPVARASVPAEVKGKMVEHLKTQCFRD